LADKFQRSIKLDVNLNDRLVSLCEHLGVNVNSYLLNEIGKAVARDEVSFRASQHTEDSKELLARLFQMLAESEDKK
jgi:predicted DNA-binding protein